jgi:hypothetical protein
VAKKTTTHTPRPSDRLQKLVEELVAAVKKARKHNAALTGINFYADKVAELRSEASNAFSDLKGPSVGDTSAMAQMIEKVFAATTPYKERVQLSRELLHSLKTSWRKADPTTPGEQDALFPLSILANTKRQYLVTIARQMNGCYVHGWQDACAVMMRRLLETVIIETYEAKGTQAKIKNASGDYKPLSDLVSTTLTETAWGLSRNTKHGLPRVRDAGHLSAHSRRFTAQRSDIDKLQPDLRIIIEELLHISGLL